MDERRFTTLADALTSLPSRRHVLTGLAGLGVSLGASWRSDDADAKKRKGKKKKKKSKKKQPTPPPPPTTPPPPPTPNQNGCLNVDVPCTSTGECCTGVCEGGVCRAHGLGTCDQEAEGICRAGNPILTLCNATAVCACIETTGASKFCGAFEVFACTDCAKDADCVDLGFPAGTACAPMSGGFCGDTCESGKVCIAPCGTKLDDL